MHTVKFWAYPDCVASSLTVPIEILAMANFIWSLQNPNQTESLFCWRIESFDGKSVRTPSGITLSVDGAIDMGANDDILYLPAMFTGPSETAFLRRLKQLEYLHPVLNRLHGQGSVIASNCNASFLLADAGLLKGGWATGSWIFERLFRDRYPMVELRSQDVLTEFNRIVSSAASTTCLNLALHLVERFAGDEVAAQCAKSLQVDARQINQSAYVTIRGRAADAHQDGLILNAQQWIRRTYDKQFNLQDLSDHLSVSQRTLIRRFSQALNTTPTNYALSLRIDLAKRLLETSALTLAEIGQRIGYSDLSSFRRLFQRAASNLKCNTS